jgi:hypothetical protein
VTLDIPDIPPSLNKVLNMHWRAKRKLAEKWGWEVKIAKGQQRIQLGRNKVLITLWHSRFYDRDNAFGACKVLVDALRYMNIIVDDTREWLELDVMQAKCPHRERHTTIVIQPAKDFIWEAVK